jgi:hypothetical protein
MKNKERVLQELVLMLNNSSLTFDEKISFNYEYKDIFKGILEDLENEN